MAGSGGIRAILAVPGRAGASFVSGRCELVVQVEASQAVRGGSACASQARRVASLTDSSSCVEVERRHAGSTDRRSRGTVLAVGVSTDAAGSRGVTIDFLVRIFTDYTLVRVRSIASKTSGVARLANLSS